MKKGLDRSLSSIAGEKKTPYKWAKGFLKKGKRIFHPYCLKSDFDIKD